MKYQKRLPVFIYLLVVPLFILLFLVKTASVQAANCTGSLTYECNGYPNNTIKATWSVDPQPGQDSKSCNIYIRGAQGDHQISSECGQNKTWGPFTVIPGANAPELVTNDAAYQLWVSNGGDCLNQKVYDTKANCPINNLGVCGNPDNSTQIKTCIGNRTLKNICDGLVAAKYNGPWGPQDKVVAAFEGASCTTTKCGVTPWSTIDLELKASGYPGPFDHSQKEIDAYNGVKVCEGGGGACTVDWSLSSDNPAANSSMTVKVTGKSDPGGWKKIGLALDNQDQKLNRIDTGPIFVFENINAGAAGSHTLSFSVNDKSTTCTPQKVYSVGASATFTTKFRIAEKLADLDKEAIITPWKDYTAAVASTPFDYTFKDIKPGQKFIFVQFMDSTGKVTTTTDCPNCQAQIKLLGADPVMTDCSLSFENSNTILNLTGQNFGTDPGTVKSGDTSLQIKSWKADSIQAVLPNAPTGQVLPVSFINADGQTGEGQCSSISQLSLGAKVFCRAPASYDTDNVAMALVDETGKKMQQTVKIDKNGVVQGLTQKLEDGKKYVLSVKAPRSLRRNVLFTAGGGTVSIPNFVLPIGDIFPLDSGDGTINTLDKSELNREWNISGDATGRSGDFNQDGKVNSIDWACMRYDFGQSDDPEPTAPSSTPVPTASPSPSPSVSPSPSPSPTATVSTSLHTT